MDEIEVQSRFLLDLYRGSFQQNAEHFLDWALERLAHDLPFDSAFWASAAATPQGPVGHFTHLYRQPEQLLVGYVPLKHLDTLFSEAMHHPGKSVRKAGADALPVFHPFLQRYHLAQGMTTMLHDADLGVFSSISLYRADGHSLVLR